MKLSILQENLVKTVQDIAKFVPAKPQIPILTCFLMKAENGRVELSATDLAVSVRSSCGGKVEVGGECAIPARTFLEYLSTLPTGALELELTGSELVVRGRRSTTSFQSMSSKEFPILSQEAEQWTELPANSFVELIEMGGLAASSDESRPVFASLYWEIDSEFIQVVSTDGYRLSRKQRKNPGWTQSSFLAPAKTMREIARIVERLKEKTVSLAVADGNMLAIKVGDAQFGVRLIEGTFPAYRNILPATYTNEMTLDREELTSALKTVIVFSRESSGVIKLKITEQDLILAATSSAVGSTEVHVALHDATGGENSIAFNGRYLFDVFGSLDTKTVKFQMNEGLKPGLFTIEGDPSFLYLVMPFRT